MLHDAGHAAWPRWLPALPVAISIAALWRWLTPAVFTHGDLLYASAQMIRERLHPSVWRAAIGPGGPDLSLWRLPVDAFYGFFGLLGLDSAVADRFVLFLPLMVLPPIVSYLFIREIVPDRAAATVGSLVFSFNTYFLAISTQGHLLITFACIAAVFGLWLLLRALREDRPRTFALGAGAVLFLAGAFDFRILTITLFIVAAIVVHHAIAPSPDRRARLSSAVRVAGTIGFVVGLLSVYWIAASAQAGTLVGNAVLSRGLFGDQFWGLDHALALHHPFWSPGGATWFRHQPVPPWLFLIPVMAAAGALIGWEDRRVRLFAGLAALGIILAKQSDEPLSFLYPWLFEHVPGFAAFREATKFYFLIALGYSVLIAVLASALLRGIRSANGARSASAALGLSAIVAIFTANLAPVVTGSIGSLYRPREMPGDYVTFQSFLERQAGDFKVLWVPRDSRWSPATLRHPRVSGAEWLESHWHRFTGDTDGPLGRRVLDMIRLPGAGELLSMSSIRYVVVPVADSDNEDDFFPEYGLPRDDYRIVLDGVGFLERVNETLGELIVYENRSFRSNMYLLPQLIELDRLQDLPQRLAVPGSARRGFTVPGPASDRAPLGESFSESPRGTQISHVASPGERRLRVPRGPRRFFVAMADSFHAGWRARVRSGGRLVASVDPRHHYELNGLSNVWFVDLDALCDQRCSGDVTVVVEFAPDRTLRLGMLVSGIAAIALMVLAIRGTVADPRRVAT